MAIINNKWLPAFFALILAGSYFIPWVSWAGTTVPGYALAGPEFFAISGKKFALDNPFPQFEFAMKVFWLIPISSIAVLILTFLNKKIVWPAVVAGVLALSQATIYILFTDMLLQLGAGNSLLSSLSFGIYLTIIAGVGLILAGMRSKGLVKTGVLIGGPLLAWLSFLLISNYIENEKYEDTANLSSAYTINGIDLIREFQANDSLANAKYREKIITVGGRVSETELPNDSTVNIKMTDTTGSYAIFSFNEKFLEAAKKIKTNDSIQIKGSCSGSIYSEILETVAITFKRCVLTDK